jgi:nucleotide-binding universal stress UspA family protein
MNSQPTRPVVVGIDGGPGSAGALRYAVTEAVRRRAPLHLVHVMPSLGPAVLAPLAPFPPMVPSGPGSITELRSVATSILHQGRETALGLSPSLDVHTRLGHGSRSASLVEASEEAQLVVVGRETHQGMERVLAGATTAAVAARAHCDVVVVPSFWTDEHSRGRVVVGIKTHSQGVELLGAAFAEAATLGATLTVVTAWELPDPYLDRIEVRTHAEDWETEGRQVLTDLLEEWRAAYPDVPVDLRIRHGRPAGVLIELSRESDVLFLCRRHHAVHAHGHLGGVAYAVLRASEVPVHVVSPSAVENPPLALVLEEAGQPVR